MVINESSKEYIDVNDGLARMGGNASLYKRLLGRFVDGNHYNDLDGAIQSGNLEEAAQHAHTIKGVSANLSLIKIASLSTDLEQALKAGSDFTILNTELKQAYDATVDLIAELNGQ